MYLGYSLSLSLSLSVIFRLFIPERILRNIILSRIPGEGESWQRRGRETEEGRQRERLRGRTRKCGSGRESVGECKSAEEYMGGRGRIRKRKSGA